MGRARRAGATPQPAAGDRADAARLGHRPIGPEPRPPRPLAPSAAGEEQGADPPLPPGVLAAAARRGVLIHRLLERLPDVAPECARTRRCMARAQCGRPRRRATRRHLARVAR
jgi:ATP-dependent helicase/nuclease subunit A